MKKLQKSSKDVKIAGVCSGFARYLNIDVTLIRLILVIWGLSGSGIVAYIIAAIIMPEGDEKEENEVKDDSI